MITRKDLIITEFQILSKYNNVYSPHEQIKFVRINSPFYKGGKWAVRMLSYCLNKNAEWEWEPLPSNRNTEFYNRCRFNTFKEAISTYNKIKWE